MTACSAANCRWKRSAQNHDARERLAATLDELRRNKGWSVVLRGHDLRLRDAPRDVAVNERDADPGSRSV